MRDGKAFNVIRLIFSEILLQTKIKTKIEEDPTLYFQKVGASRISNMILKGGVATKSKSQRWRTFLFKFGFAVKTILFDFAVKT